MRRCPDILGLSVIFFLFANLVSGQKQNNLQGHWQNNQHGYAMTLILNADGSGEFDGESMNYKVKEATLSVDILGTATLYDYVLNGNSLALTGGDLEGQLVFTRKGKIKPQKQFSQTAKDLVGLWSGNGEMIEFRADGTCIYLGDPFPYKVSHGHIIITTGQGKVVFEYTIGAGKLALTANGQKVTYTRPAGTRVK